MDANEESSSHHAIVLATPVAPLWGHDVCARVGEAARLGCLSTRSSFGGWIDIKHSSLEGKSEVAMAMILLDAHHRRVYLHIFNLIAIAPQVDAQSVQITPRPSFRP